MIKVEDVIKVFGNLIFNKYSKELVDISNIVNADSIRGPQLTKVVNGVETPYDTCDNVLVLELLETPGGPNLTETRRDDKLLIEAKQSLHFTLYGENCRTLALSMIAFIQTSWFILQLQLNDISLVRVSESNGMTEFINNTRYLRRDFTIDLSFSLNPTKEDEATLEEDTLSLEVKKE